MNQKDCRESLQWPLLSSPEPSTGAARSMGIGLVVSVEWEGRKITNVQIKIFFQVMAFSEMNVY